MYEGFDPKFINNPPGGNHKLPALTYVVDSAALELGSYGGVDTDVKESWARGVQTELTRLDYPGYTPRYTTNYTGVMTDLIDGIGKTADDSTYTVDRVSGFTLPQIEFALISFEPGVGVGAQSWANWKVRLIDQNPNNPTTPQIGQIFNYWKKI